MKTFSTFLSALALVLGYSCALFGQPIITSLTPTQGPTTGGNIVVINGSGFTGALSVAFGSTAALSFIVNNDQKITATAPPEVPGVVNVSVTTLSGTSPRTSESRYVYQGVWFAYIASVTLGQVTPIDLSTNIAGSPITIAGEEAFSIAITPDGRTAYVTLHSISNLLDGVASIDLATNTVGVFIPLPITSPSGIAIAPDGTTAFVVCLGTSDVFPIDLATNTLGSPITVDQCFDIAITPDGTTAYVTGVFTSLIYPIDLVTRTVGVPISFPGAPQGIGITPDGKTAYIAATDSSVIPLDIATNTLGAPIPVGGAMQTLGIAITADGKVAFSCNGASNSVSPIDIATNTAGAPIPVGTNPLFMAITPDSKMGYVTDFASDSVIPVTVSTGAIGTPISVSPRPMGIAITPDQAPLASFSASVAPGNTVTFDASSSASPVGTIALYAWDFGDGQSETTTTPVVTHKYVFGGFYNVTLTVTNTAGTSTARVFTGHVVSNNGGPNAFASLSMDLPPISPVFTGRRVSNKFLTQTEYVDVLSWTSNDPSVVILKLFRNGELIQTYSGTGVFSYEGHNRRKNEINTYVLIASSASGLESSPVTITVP